MNQTTNPSDPKVVIPTHGHKTLLLHPEISMRKEKIFNELDPKKRRTKIVCTLG